MPLESIIKLHKTSPRGGRAGRGGRRPGSGAPSIRRNNREAPKPVSGARRGYQPRRAAQSSDDQWAHDRYEDNDNAGKNRLQGRLGPKPGGSAGAKIHVTNLFYNVSEDDLEEVFSDVGQLKSVHIHFDRSGRSLGTADVIFVKKEDAVAAVEEYNGAALDGQAMQISLVSGNTTTARNNNDDAEMEDLVISTSVRDQGRQVATNDRVNRRPTQKAGSNFLKTRGARGARRTFGGRGGAHVTAKPVTAEDLDADLDAYIANK